MYIVFCSVVIQQLQNYHWKIVSSDRLIGAQSNKKVNANSLKLRVRKADSVIKASGTVEFEDGLWIGN